MRPWKKKDRLGDELRVARYEPSEEFVDAMTRSVEQGPRASRPSKARGWVAILGTAAVMVVVAAMGGAGYAANAVTTLTTSSTTVNSSADCTNEAPCSFDVNPTPTSNHLTSTQTNADATNKVHIPGGAPQDIFLTYTVMNSCTNTNAAGLITLQFADNPIPAGDESTTFTISTHNAPNGVYVFTVTGTSGAQTDSNTFTVVVGPSNHCPH
jgi:hypothetical protein